MFNGIKDALRGLWPSSPAADPPVASAAVPDCVLAPSFANPWEDPTLSAPDRYASYDAVVREHCQRIYEAGTREGVTQEERYAISQDPENQMWFAELKQLVSETPEAFCYRIDGVAQRELLGRNFLGAKEWKKAFGVDVGGVPPIPQSITKELLEGECPLHTGQKIKDTHILVLIPKTVNGEPYTALKLGGLCAKSKGSGDRLIFDGADWAKAWKRQDWAKLPQAQSEWVLLPKSDPDPEISPEKHFRSKNIAAQAKVHMEHYPEYREVAALEVMTMALLNDLVNGEPRILDGWNHLRCVEENAYGGRVCVGNFDADGLGASDTFDGHAYGNFGRALARKLQT
jgi:hypothetical protein